MSVDFTVQDKYRRRHAWLALGSNEHGAWLDPEHTLTVALRKLNDELAPIKWTSGLFITRPVGGGRQSAYLNAVALVELRTGPAELLRGLKRLERKAGRRLGRRWGPRTLDLDILTAGCITGYRRTSRTPARRDGRLLLPHPEMHRRGFVLFPLIQGAPHGWHPILRQSFLQLARAPFVARQAHDVHQVTPGMSWWLRPAAPR
jgi:2-amino-4-hydroxy-6-hydroxymethyldihydropteridine diphosphokinase